MMLKVLFLEIARILRNDRGRPVSGLSAGEWTVNAGEVSTTVTVG